MLASYNLQSTFSVFSFYEAKISPWIIGGILAVLTGWCLLGGGSRIVKVTSMVVPVMGIAYIGISLLVVIINIQNVPAMFVRIFEEAFDFKAIFGAFSGSAMMQGIRRGLYSNEAGIGSAPNASAVYVLRDRSGKRIAGSTVGAGISSGITWFHRSGLYYSCNGIFCIYNSAWELFLL